MRHTIPILALAALTLPGCLFSSSSGAPVNSDTAGGSNNTVGGSNNTPNNSTANGTPNNTSNNTTGNTVVPDSCGNGTLDLGETCDPCEGDYRCPSGGCALWVQTGSKETCDIACARNGQQTTCVDGDGCCPDACTSANDDDCSDSCPNGVIDEGETCDPCPESCDDSVCAPAAQSGDASTCTLACTPGPVPEECCGGQLCPSNQSCEAGVCTDIPTGCSQQPTPDLYCAQLMGPGSTCVGDRCVPGQGSCTDDTDCLPWESCSNASCVEPPHCMTPKSREYCAWDKWGSDGEFTCMPGGNGAYACVPSTVIMFCMEGTCAPWQACDQGTCVVPDTCSRAQQPDVYCMFATERVNTSCVNNTCL